MRHAFLLSVILLTLINGTYIEVKAQDVTDPTVTISNVPDDTERDEFPITITFGADVTGFEDDDIELGGGVTATVVLRGSSPVYTALITPTSSGDLTIKVPANVVDGGNQASNTVTVTIDLPPTVTLTVPSTIQNAAFEVTITFNEDVTGLEKDEILLTGPSLSHQPYRYRCSLYRHHYTNGRCRRYSHDRNRRERRRRRQQSISGKDGRS